MSFSTTGMKTKKYAIFIFVLLLLIILVPPLIARADGLNQNITIPNPFNCGGALGNCDLLTLLTAILNNVLMPIAAVVAVMYIVFAGFKFVQARGNPGEIDKAKQRLLWTLIGVGILLGAAGISAVLQATVKSFLK